jgi:hypothetical protein
MSTTLGDHSGLIWLVSILIALAVLAGLGQEDPA